MFQDFLNLYQEEILTLFGLLITIAIELARRQFTAWTGIQIEEKHSRMLKEALMTGAKTAIERSPQAAMRMLKEQALAHARESVPDAIRALVPGDGVLDRLATRAVMEALESRGILPKAG